MDSTTFPEAEYFRDFETMFNSDGWFQLVEELKSELEAIPETLLWGAVRMEDVFAARARWATLYSIINKPDEITGRLEALRLEREMDAAERDTTPRLDV